MNSRTVAQRAAQAALAKLDRLASAVASARQHTLTTSLKIQDGAPADTIGTPCAEDLLALASSAGLALAKLEAAIQAAAESE